MVEKLREMLKNRKNLIAVCTGGGILLTAVIITVIVIFIKSGNKENFDKNNGTQVAGIGNMTTDKNKDTDKNTDKNTDTDTDESDKNTEDTGNTEQNTTDSDNQSTAGNNNANTNNSDKNTGGETGTENKNPQQGNAVKPVYVKPATGRVESGDNPNISLALTLFCTGKTGQANNVQLNWTTKNKALKYEVYRSTTQNGEYSLIYTTTGTSYQDYNLAVGNTYYYKIVAVGLTRETSGIRYAKPTNINHSNLNIMDNQVGSAIKYATSGTIAGGTYYQWGTSASGQGLYFWEKTSSDGVHFSNQRIIINSKQASCLSSCKLEAVNIEYVESINKVVIYAHWETYGSDYSNGKAFIATGTPGGEFTFHECDRPLGIYVRDMSLFFDDDGSGYLVAATNRAGEGANKSIRIFKLKPDMSGVEKVVAVVHDNQYREAPHIIKRDGYYYLFTSQAAGWYPSAGAYASASSVSGPWSDAKSIGNTSTFSSQSGWIWQCGYNYLMMGNRWIKGGGTSSNSVLPIAFDNGCAYYDYFPYILYNNSTGEVYPVQLGENVSQNKPVTSETGAKIDRPPSNATDGDYMTWFEGTGGGVWPAVLNIDLGKIYDLTNVQISWYICKGSEGYYTYTVETSEDGKLWNLVLDRMNTSNTIVNSTYGFSSCLMSCKGRYVRIYVEKATLWNNPDNNWYTPTIYEVKVFGTASSEQTPKNILPTEKGAVIDMNFEAAPDNNYIQNAGLCPYRGYLFGNAKFTTEAGKGRCLYLDGKGTYMQLPTGLLDGNNQMTISMDVKSESEGNIFTFAMGKDDKKYFFFKVVNNQVRCAITTNSWSDESGSSYDLNAGQWHKYTYVINQNRISLYVDGKHISTADVNATAKISDLGNGCTILIGKSYYGADGYFKGYIDNLKIYNYALDDSQIISLK